MTWLGLVCVALARPTELWSAAIFLLTLAFFLGGVPVAIYRTGRTRAFALGFLVFGAGYLACLTPICLQFASPAMTASGDILAAYQPRRSHLRSIPRRPAQPNRPVPNN